MVCFAARFIVWISQLKIICVSFNISMAWQREFVFTWISFMRHTTWISRPNAKCIQSVSVMCECAPIIFGELLIDAVNRIPPQLPIFIIEFLRMCGMTASCECCTVYNAIMWFMNIIAVKWKTLRHFRPDVGGNGASHSMKLIQRSSSAPSAISCLLNAPNASTQSAVCILVFHFTFISLAAAAAVVVIIVLAVGVRFFNSTKHTMWREEWIRDTWFGSQVANDVKKNINIRGRVLRIPYVLLAKTQMQSLSGLRNSYARTPVEHPLIFHSCQKYHILQLISVLFKRASAEQRRQPAASGHGIVNASRFSGVHGECNVSHVIRRPHQSADAFLAHHHFDFAHRIQMRSETLNFILSLNSESTRIARTFYSYGYKSVFAFISRETLL